MGVQGPALGHIAGLRPAWAIQDPVSKQNQFTKLKKDRDLLKEGGGAMAQGELPGCQVVWLAQAKKKAPSPCKLTALFPNLCPSTGHLKIIRKRVIHLKR